MKNFAILFSCWLVSSLCFAAHGSPSADHTAETKMSKSSTTRFPRRIVLEEGTGTWCGYCPRGHATIDKMKELYPDNFIAIAVHGGDDMYAADEAV